MTENPSKEFTTWKTAYHSVCCYGVDNTSSLQELIVKAWMKSDPYNQARLELAYPKLVELLISTITENEQGETNV